MSLQHLVYTLTFFVCVIFSGIAAADSQIATINKSSLPYEFLPSNYDNSPSNYNNSASNYDDGRNGKDGCFSGVIASMNGELSLVLTEHGVKVLMLSQ